jgi:hypothetical protein
VREEIGKPLAARRYAMSGDRRAHLWPLLVGGAGWLVVVVGVCSRTSFLRPCGDLICG